MTVREMRFRLAGVLGAAFLRVLGLTIRVRVEDDGPLREMRREGRPVILACWHQWILPAVYVHRDQGVVAIVSQHGDGEYMTRVLDNLGFGRTARGSSTRGGSQGLKDLLRAIKDGHIIAFTPDGPKGPPKKVKRGAIVAAQMSGAAIFPLAVGGKRQWRAGSWDGMVVPKPFAKITLKYGTPHFVPRELTDDDLARHTARLESELDRVTDYVDR